MRKTAHRCATSESRTQKCFFLYMFPTQSSSGGQTPDTGQLWFAGGLAANLVWMQAHWRQQSSGAQSETSSVREERDPGCGTSASALSSGIAGWNSLKFLQGVGFSSSGVCWLESNHKVFFIRGSSFSVFKWQAVVAFPSNVWSLWEEVKTGREGQVSS